MQNVLRMSDDEIEEMQKQIDDEKESGEYDDMAELQQMNQNGPEPEPAFDPNAPPPAGVPRPPAPTKIAIPQKEKEKP